MYWAEFMETKSFGEGIYRPYAVRAAAELAPAWRNEVTLATLVIG